MSFLRKKNDNQDEELIIDAGAEKGITYYISTVAKNLFLIIVVLLLWEFLPRLGVIKPSLLPSISTIAEEWWKLLVDRSLYPDILISLERALLGFGIAMLIGIPLGIVIGYFKLFSQIVSPLIHIFRQIPALSLFPVFILFFGIGELSKVAIVFWVAVWPILLNTVGGVRHVDPLLIKAAKSMGAGNGKILTTVVLPSIVPSMMTGVRLGAGSSVVALVSAEMIGAKSGLGFMIMNSQYNFQIPKMYVAILTIAVIGILINQLLVRLEKRLTFWSQTIDSV